MPSGRAIELTADIENPLLDGSYTIACWVTTPSGQNEFAQQVTRLIEFSVEGG